MNKRLLRLLTPVIVVCGLCAAQDISSFEKRITVKKLDNGLTVLICERPEAPVFAFYTHVDAGSVQDPMGQTGLAHMFEHMAFKGTDKIGTKDYPAEKAALEKVEKAYAAYIYERDKRVAAMRPKSSNWKASGMPPPTPPINTWCPKSLPRSSSAMAARE